jgi:SAM-dependent methyltransferase
MPDRTNARALAQRHLAARDPLGWFEPLYSSATNDPTVIPWADLKPNPNLLTWLEAHPLPAQSRALKVGCGLGDDAEELARRGLRVTAFDIAPTAIAWCKRRFPGSRVEYVVADLLNPAPAWNRAFDFVLESYTLQVLPPALRAKAVRSLEGFLAEAAELLLVCRAREPDEPEGQMPWPLTRNELAGLARAAGLAERVFEDFHDNQRPPVRRFRCVYRRAGSLHGSAGISNT